MAISIKPSTTDSKPIASEEISKEPKTMFSSLFTKEELQDVAAILAPHGPVKFQVFLSRRKLVAATSVFLALMLAYSGKALIFDLQSWATVSLAITFGLIYFGHTANGDFSREKYEAPQQLSETNAE